MAAQKGQGHGMQVVPERQDFSPAVQDDAPSEAVAEGVATLIDSP